MDELPDDVRRKADEIMSIFRIAVRKAQAESRRLGVPNVYWENGQRYFEFPNGEITRDTPPGWRDTRVEEDVTRQAVSIALLACQNGEIARGSRMCLLIRTSSGEWVSCLLSNNAFG